LYLSSFALMAKRVLKLNDNDNFDFLLIGIVCHHRDYRLCMAINKKLELSLSKQDEYAVFNNKRMEDNAFSFYEYINEEEDRYNLLSNKSQKGFLIPEQNQIDYFFLIRMTPMRIDEQELLNALKEIPVVLGAYKMDVLKLKSKENLVF
jgi:hypothetical protein